MVRRFAYGLNPDIMTMRRTILRLQPISAISLGARMGQSHCLGQGELWSMAILIRVIRWLRGGLKNLEVIERDGLVTRVKKSIGPYFQRP